VSFCAQNTIFALLPYLGLWLIVMSSGGGADRLQSHGVLSTTATRKVMQLIGPFDVPLFHFPYSYTVKNVRMSTADVARRVFRVLTEPVPYAFVSVRKSTE